MSDFPLRGGRRSWSPLKLGGGGGLDKGSNDRGHYFHWYPGGRGLAPGSPGLPPGCPGLAPGSPGLPRAPEGNKGDACMPHVTRMIQWFSPWYMH